MAAQSLEHLDCVGHVQLGHLDGLEPARQGAILFDVAAQLFVGGGADAADTPARQEWLEQIRRVHAPARNCTRAHDGVQFVDEDDGVFLFLDGAQDRLETLLEIAAVARARQERAHVDGENRGPAQGHRRLARFDPRGHAFDDGGLAHARVADEQGIVLPPPGQHVQRTFDLLVAADERVDLALARAFVQVHGVDRQGIFRRTFLMRLAFHAGLGFAIAVRGPRQKLRASV